MSYEATITVDYDKGDIGPLKIDSPELRSSWLQVSYEPYAHLKITAPSTAPDTVTINFQPGTGLERIIGLSTCSLVGEVFGPVPWSPKGSGAQARIEIPPDSNSSHSFWYILFATSVSSQEESVPVSTHLETEKPEIPYARPLWLPKHPDPGGLWFPKIYNEGIPSVAIAVSLE